MKYEHFIVSNDQVRIAESQIWQNTLQGERGSVN